MQLNEKPATTLALFCKVIDNYGDIGICWRLARQLQSEHDIAVTLWVDDLRSFQRICPPIALDAELQRVAGVAVRHWRHQDDQDAKFAVAEIADIVIEFFGCDIPSGYIAAMAECQPRPVWLNLEGLSAEEWVEGCHTLPSSHPRLSLTKYFFFPGFTAKTGGLLCEAALEQQRLHFQSDPAQVADFLAQLGATAVEIASFKVSLFCYPQAPVAALFETWQAAEMAITCLVPEGVASDAIAAFLAAPAIAGAVRTRGNLTVRVVPFVAQADYDKLLWACDLNFVRGEDSIVRAQWAGKPFVWHIYPQDENLHHVKLRAFLQRYAADIDSLKAFSWRWNGAAGGMEIGTEIGPEIGTEAAQAEWAALWLSFQADLPKMVRRAVDWQREMHGNGDLAGNLLRFVRSFC